MDVRPLTRDTAQRWLDHYNGNKPLKSIDEMLHGIATEGDRGRCLLATIEHEVVGIARMWADAEDPTKLTYLFIRSRSPEHADNACEQLFAAMATWVRHRGGAAVHAWCKEGDDEVPGSEFWRRMGLVESSRERLYMRKVSDTDASIEQEMRWTVETLADRPDLIRAAFVVNNLTRRDVPRVEALAPLKWETWLANCTERPGFSFDHTFVALDGSRVIGYGELERMVADPATVWHSMTGSLPAYRGQGVATDLKRASIAWAARNGITRLRAGNDANNQSMLGINARLGYLHDHDMIELIGEV